MTVMKPADSNKPANPTLEKAISLVAHARSLSLQYDGRQHEMPGEVVEQITKCNQEATRLRKIVAAEEEAKSLEEWANSPADYPANLKAAGNVAMQEGPRYGDGSSQHYLEAQKNLAVERFCKSLRYGADSLSIEEKNALVEDTTGELIVPEAVAGPIFKTLPDLGVMRGLALVRPTTSNRVDVRSINQNTVGWGKLETGVGTPPTDVLGSPPAENDIIRVHNLYGEAKLGEDELADSDANLASLISEIVGQMMAEAEDDALTYGDGTNKPTGVAHANSGVASTTTASGFTLEEVKGLQYKVSSRFRNNGAFLASTGITEDIALAQNSDGYFVWQPSAAQGEPDRLFGKPFATADGLPDPGGTASPTRTLVFGDFRSGYLIADRQQMRVKRLSEKYATEGKVGFLFSMRVGGGVIRPAAMHVYQA